jgi:F-type H+-transporting ATPase subunit a
MNRAFIVVTIAALAALSLNAYASSEHGEEHGEEHEGPTLGADGKPIGKAQETADFILHHVSDDEEFAYEVPFMGHLPALHISNWFGSKPGEGLYIEKTPGACSIGHDDPSMAAFKPFPSLGAFIHGCYDLRPTKAILMMWIAMGLLGIFLFLGRKRDSNGVPKGLFSHVVESLVVFVRDEIAIKNIGPEEGPKYTPYLATCFFFIMFMNYLGLFPGFFTGTGVITVTTALAVMTFVVTQIAGIRSAGIGGYVGHLFGDVPTWMKPLMFVVEFIGLFTKPFALLVRLFANMLAGHMVLFFLLSLIFVWHVGAAVLSVPMAAAIYVLELFVAILQAYIFTLLSALFIGQSVALGHHHGDDHGHAADAKH